MSKTICSVSGCNNQVYARGWCRNHYQKWRRCGDTGDHRKKRGVCSYPGCNRPHKSRGYCDMHYKRVWRHDDVERDRHSKAFLGECIVDGCKSKAIAKGYCQKHYARICRNGNLAVKKDINGTRKSHPIEYRIWQGIKKRCYNPNEKCYEHYGGRGITVCDRWIEKPNGFKNFLEDMGERPHGEEAEKRALYSIDRIDNEKGYSPDNCRWTVRLVQANNKSSNVRITINGETKTLTQWSRFYGLNKGTVFARYYRGWRGEKLFSSIHNV